MQVGDKVQVVPNHKFHPNRYGIILFFGEEASAGLVILQDLEDISSVFAVDINDLLS